MKMFNYMKHVALLIVTIAISLQSFGQVPISPYYPEPLSMKPSPITFVEFNHIAWHLDPFMSKEFSMSPEPDKVKINKNNYGTLTRTYIENTVGTTPQRLNFEFEVFVMEGHKIVIKSVNITGDIEPLLWFYVIYWPTKVGVEQLRNEKNAITYYYMDKAIFNGNQISINNTTLIDHNKFITDFESKKISPQTREETNKVGILDVRTERGAPSPRNDNATSYETNTIKIERKTSTYVVVKRNDKYTSDELSNSDLLQVSNLLNKPYYRNGNYEVVAVEVFEDGVLTQRTITSAARKR